MNLKRSTFLTMTEFFTLVSLIIGNRFLKQKFREFLFNYHKKNIVINIPDKCLSLITVCEKI